MINPQWLELHMSRTNFHGPKDVRAIEVRLYTDTTEMSEARYQSRISEYHKVDIHKEFQTDRYGPKTNGVYPGVRGKYALLG